jgi:hypothetical protein
VLRIGIQRRRETAHMEHRFGPHTVIGTGEITATLVMLAVALLAFAWMAYGTRRTGRG